MCMLASTDKEKQVIDIFYQMCDTISDTLESEPKYEVIMVLVKFIFEIKHVEGDISNQVIISMGEKLSKNCIR